MPQQNLDLKNQAYTLKVMEGKLNCEPCGNMGSLDNNISETINSCNNMSNYLKTHQMCSNENLSVLKFVIAQVGSQAATNHQVNPQVKRRAEQTQKSIFSMQPQKMAA